MVIQNWNGNFLKGWGCSLKRDNEWISIKWNRIKYPSVEWNDWTIRILDEVGYYNDIDK